MILNASLSTCNSPWHFHFFCQNSNWVIFFFYLLQEGNLKRYPTPYPEELKNMVKTAQSVAHRLKEDESGDESGRDAKPVERNHIGVQDVGVKVSFSQMWFYLEINLGSPLSSPLRNDHSIHRWRNICNTFVFFLGDWSSLSQWHSIRHWALHHIWPKLLFHRMERHFRLLQLSQSPSQNCRGLYDEPWGHTGGTLNCFILPISNSTSILLGLGIVGIFLFRFCFF